MIGVIGCGNMARAIVKGIHQKFSEEKFLTYTPTFIGAKALADEVNGRAVRELEELSECDIILIACKPQQFKDLAQSLSGKIDLSQKYIISIMAALPVTTIQTELKVETVSRVMPNTPSLFGEGVSLLYHSQNVSLELQEKAAHFFSACSKVHHISDESLFDKVTTVTGSGPAYVFYFAKTLADQLASWGVPENEAREMVAQLFKGSSKLMEENSSRSWSGLIDEVTSKGGVTIEAVKVYQDKNLDAITQLALESAFQRTLEIKKALKI